MVGRVTVPVDAWRAASRSAFWRICWTWTRRPNSQTPIRMMMKNGSTTANSTAAVPRRFFGPNRFRPTVLFRPSLRPGRVGRAGRLVLIAAGQSPGDIYRGGQGLENLGRLRHPVSGGVVFAHLLERQRHHPAGPAQDPEFCKVSAV